MTALQTGVGIVKLTMQHTLPAKFDSPEARVQLLAIGLQESGFTTRQQSGGPARGFWQFEKGGVDSVLSCDATRRQARSVCVVRTVPATTADVYFAIGTDDQLACAFARLLLWSDSLPLPQLGAASDAFAYYTRNWRPGAYARGTPQKRAQLEANWSSNYAAALAAVGATA
jgi:hypothetical protein